MAKIAHADILTAFSEKTIGTKVVDQERFSDYLSDLLDNSEGRVTRLGQECLTLSIRGVKCLSGGVGKHTGNPDDYVLRNHRGRVQAFLKREKAATVTGGSVIVYTKEAYLKDPEVIGTSEYGTSEYDRIQALDCDYVLVAVLSRSGKADPSLSAFRFVSNLAGNNNEALEWTLEEVRAKAKAVLESENEWAVVAD